MHSNIVYLNIFTVIDENQALVKPPKSMSWLVLCFYYDCVVEFDAELFKAIIFAVKNHCVVHSNSVVTQHMCRFV